MTKKWIGPVAVLAMLAFSALVYSSLPERVPTHWNIQGEVDGWSSPLWGAVVAPGAALLLWLLLPVLRRIDPRRRNYEQFDRTFWLVVNVIILFMAAMHVLSLGMALGWPVDVGRGVLVIVGLLLAVLGNYLPRLRSNWWMGIRTPWTLDSERVWRATHRLGGVTFVVGGLVTAAAALLPTTLAGVIAITAIGVSALIPAAYSYFAYRSERASGEAPSREAPL